MTIDSALLDKLTQQAKASPRLRMNFDLRTSPEDSSQRMLNALEPGTILPIHRHPGTTEVVVILRGSATQYFYSLTPDPSPKGEGRVKTADPMWYEMLKKHAKEMRQNPTEAENVLWQALRDNALGAKFRRQHVICDYIVDFVCLDRKLTIEVDGGYHNEAEQQKYDAMRSGEMELRGYRELRFRNEEVLGDLDGVLNRISALLELPLLKERVGVRLDDCVTIKAGSECPAMSVEKGRWHRIESLESGTVIFEAKDGAYEPLSPEDILELG